MRRAVPLWRSDYAFRADRPPMHTYGISLWLPYPRHRHHRRPQRALLWQRAHAVRALPFLERRRPPAWASGIDMRVREIDYAALRRWSPSGRRVAPTTTATSTPDPWIPGPTLGWPGSSTVPSRAKAWCRPSAAQGGDGSLRLKLHGLQPDAVYSVTTFDTVGAAELTGRELQEGGLPVAIKDRPGTAVITYRKKS